MKARTENISKYFPASRLLKVLPRKLRQKKNSHRQTRKRAQHENHNENHADIADAERVGLPHQRPGRWRTTPGWRSGRSRATTSPAAVAVDSGSGCQSRSGD